MVKFDVYSKMVKNEQHDDYALSVEAIELETELFRKELFEPQPVCPEPSGEDDLFNIFQSSDLGLSDGSEPWCSPGHSSGSSTRSSSTIDDKIDMFDHLTNGLQLGGEWCSPGHSSGSSTRSSSTIDDKIDMFDHLTNGLQLGGEWCSPGHSSGSSTRSSSTIDDKIDMFDHLTNGLQLGDEFSELTQIFSSQPLPVTGLTEVQQKHLLQHQQQEPTSQQKYQSQNVSSTNNLNNHFNYSQFQSANSSSPAIQHFTHSTSPSNSRISSSSSPTCSNGCSPTALYSSSGPSSVFSGSSSGVSGSYSSNSSPVFIKTEDVQSPSGNSHSPPLSGVWQQLLSDGNNMSLATAHEGSSNNGTMLTFPKFKIVKTESINGSSRPILNVTTTTRNNDKNLVINSNNTITNTNRHRVLNNGATTLVTTTVLNNNNFNSSSVSPRSIKSSPPCSPTPLYSSYAFSPSSPSDMEGGASPTSPPLTTTITIPGGGPRYKVLSISTTAKGSPGGCHNNDLTSRRSTLAGGITKTKKIQPKVSAVRSMLSQAANSGGGGGRGVLELVTNAAAKLAGSTVHLSPVPTANTLVPVTPKIEVPPLPGCPPLLPSTAAPNSVSSSISFSHQVKVQKRHERMIKNRESASLSRKKKKEYVTNLENEIKYAKDENASLKQEVSRLTSLVSELQRECSSLRQRLSSTGSFLSQSSSMLLPSATVTKATAPALMLTVFCLLAINLPGMLPQWPSAPSHPNALLRGAPPSSPDLLLLPPAPTGLTQRRLLWSDYDDDDLPPPALNDTFFNSTMCPSMLNETESLRLESELRDWFDNKLQARWPRKRPAVASLLARRPDDATISLSPRVGLSVASKRKGGGQRRRRGSSSWRGEADDTKALRLIGSKSSGTDDAARNALSAPQQRLPSVYRRYFYNDPSPLTIHPSLQSASETGLVDSLESPAPPPSLLEVIQSRQDTYYVVSLSRDLLLVPAELHNSTNTRPRMTLLIPAPLHHGGNSSGGSGSSSGGQVAMLQIDCEVLHTSLVDVADLVVPPHEEQPHQKQRHSGPPDTEEGLDDSPTFGTHKSRKYHQEMDPSTNKKKNSGEDPEFYSEHAKNTATTYFKPKYEQKLERLSKYGNLDTTGKFFRKHSSGYQRRNVKPSNTSTSLDAASRADEVNQTRDSNGLYDKDDEIPYSDEQFGPLYDQGHLDSVVDHPYRLHPKHLKKTDPNTRQSGNATSVTSRAEEHQQTAVAEAAKNRGQKTSTNVKKEQRTKDWLYGKN